MARKIWAFCLLCQLITSVVSAQGLINPTPEQIIASVINKNTENEALKRQFVTFQRQEIVYDLDKDGNPIFPEREIRTVNSNASATPIDLNRVFTNRYNFSFAAEQDANAYVILFYPKRNQPDETSVIYQVANRLEGKIYVNKKYLYVTRLDSRLTDGFNKFAGLARVKRADIVFEQEMRPDLHNIITIKYFRVTVRYRKAFLWETFQRWDYLYFNYRFCCPP